MSLDRTSKAFLDIVCDERPQGWVPAGCMLPDADGRARKKLCFGSAPDPMMICAVVVPNEDVEHLSDSLEELVTERVEEFGIQRFLGIGTTVGSRRRYEALGVLDRKCWEPPPDAPPGAETST